MIERSDENGIATLRLAHGKASALDLELLGALSAALREARDSGARAIVLTGTGSIFSAGVDLVRMTGEGAAYVERFLPALDDAFRTLFTLELPVVAALNGHAIAGGCILAQACDARLMAQGKGRIGVPELLVGVPVPPLAVEILRYALPAARLQSLLFTGATLLPDEALAQGVVDEVVVPEQLLPRAIELATAMAQIRPDAFAVTKRLLRAPAIEAAASGDRRDGGAVSKTWSATETHDAIRDYLQRTIGRR